MKVSRLLGGGREAGKNASKWNVLSHADAVLNFAEDNLSKELRGKNLRMSIDFASAITAEEIFELAFACIRMGVLTAKVSTFFKGETRTTNGGLLISCLATNSSGNWKNKGSRTVAIFPLPDT